MELATARDLALILLALQAFILVLVPGVIFYFLVKGMHQGTKWLKEKGFPEAQRYSRLVADETKRYSGKVTEPITEAEANVTRAKGTVSGVSTVLRRRSKRRYHA